MPDKPYNQIDPLDRRLREGLPVCDDEGTQLRIEKIVGFELFNTRSYHNYETWSDGYRIVGPLSRAWAPWPTFREAAAGYGLDDEQTKRLWMIASGERSGLLKVQREDLDDALDTWFGRREQVRAILAEDPPGPNQTTRLAVLGVHLPRKEES